MPSRFARDGIPQLETDGWSEGDAQVAVGPIVEVNLVAHLRPQSDRPEIGFNATAGVEHPEGIVGGQVSNLVYESRGRILVRHTKIQKPALNRPEQAHRPTARLDLRTKQPVKSTQPAGDHARVHSVRERAAKVAFKVIPHLGFQLNVVVNVDADPSPQADEVNGRVGGIQPEQLGESAHLAMVLRKR